MTYDIFPYLKTFDPLRLKREEKNELERQKYAFSAPGEEKKRDIFTGGRAQFHPCACRASKDHSSSL